jgi:hypothetical protein
MVGDMTFCDSDRDVTGVGLGVTRMGMQSLGKVRIRIGRLGTRDDKEN